MNQHYYDGGENRQVKRSEPGFVYKRCRYLESCVMDALHKADELSDDVLAAIEGTS